MQISQDVVKTFFEKAINHIVFRVQQLLDKPEVKGVSTIVMVGGFSESQLLVNAVRSNFRNIKVIAPKDAQIAVIKGAVIFGHLPTVINSRVSKYTYGTDCLPLFDEAQHDRSKACECEDGKTRCKDVFDKIVEIGQTLKVGVAQFEKTYRVHDRSQTRMSMDIYITKEKDPKYVTDAGCQKIATYSVPITGRGLDRCLKIRLIFGGTELEIECFELNTGKETFVYADFLSC